jgi:hypothetical protein
MATTGPWRQFAETSHQIFTGLATPTEPWVQQPFVRGNTQLPWAEVLEWACGWAARTSDRAAAATRITLAVFTLGGELIRYSCSSGAPSNYSSIGFDCTAFLERLSGGFGRGPAVNCTDCATIVSTFANAVGCDLWQSRMFNQIVPFEVNPIRLIGQGTFGPVCGTGLFNYHEVAWEGLCTAMHEVYDACIAALAPTPPSPGLTPIVPTNIRPGWPNQALYRDLLVAPSSRWICQPQPLLSRTRRPVF